VDGVKRTDREDEHSSHSSASVKNFCGCTSTPPHPPTPPCVRKVRDSVAFTLIIDILEDGWQNDDSENGLIMAFPE